MPQEAPLMMTDETSELLRLREETARRGSHGHGTSGGSSSAVGHNGSSSNSIVARRRATSSEATDADAPTAHHACVEDVALSPSYAGPTVAGIKPRTWMLFSLLGGLIYGYNVSMAAPLQYIKDDLNLTSFEQEMVSATATLSDASSMLVGGRLADAFGRKPMAMLACGGSILGTLLGSMFSGSFGWLLFWRLCTGIGNGLSILLLPMYISECVDAEHRGTYLTLFQLGVNSGCAVPYLFLLVVNENWRSCLAFGSFPALYVLYSFYFVFPESVKWLRWKEDPEKFDLEGGDHEATTASTGSTSGVDPRVSSSGTNSTSRQSAPRLELLIGILLAWVNNCVDASLFYGPEIISKALTNYTRQDANIFGLLCALLAAISVAFAARFLINTHPRRQIYLLCLAIVTGTFLVSGIIFDKYSTDDFKSNSMASTSVIATFGVMNIFAAIGPSILFVVILSELFTDSSYRARYMSYCTFSMSLFSLLVNGTLLTLFETLGTSLTFIAYGLTYGVCLIFFWFYLPETKHRELV